MIFEKSNVPIRFYCAMLRSKSCV